MVISKQHAYKSLGAELDFRSGEDVAATALLGGGLPGDGTEGEGNTTAIAAAGRAPNFLLTCDLLNKHNTIII